MDGRVRIVPWIFRSHCPMDGRVHIISVHVNVRLVIQERGPACGSRRGRRRRTASSRPSPCPPLLLRLLRGSHGGRPDAAGGADGAEAAEGALDLGRREVPAAGAVVRGRPRRPVAGCQGRLVAMQGRLLLLLGAPSRPRRGHRRSRLVFVGVYQGTLSSWSSSLIGKYPTDYQITPF